MAKKKKKISKAAKQRRIVIVSIGIIVFAIVTCIFLKNQKELSQKKKELSEVNEMCAEQSATNEELESVLSGDMNEYLERLARSKYGYCKPNEHVYYDITPNP